MTILSRALFPVWLALVGAGFAAVWRYEAGAGVAAPSAPASGAQGRLDPSRPTILAFVHPDCPCTRATLEGLAEVAARRPGRARIVVEIVGQGGSANERMARRIPGATVAMDPQGADARRYGVVTSGQILVFAPDGSPRFRGGLTAARGHYGPSEGQDALAAILSGAKTAVRATPVYGCALAVGGAR